MVRLVKHSTKVKCSGNLSTYLCRYSSGFIIATFSRFSTLTKYNEFNFTGDNGITKYRLTKSLFIWHTRAQYTNPKEQFSTTVAEIWCFTINGWQLSNRSVLKECKPQFDDVFLVSVTQTKSCQTVDGNDNHEQSVESLIAIIYSSCFAPNFIALVPIFKIF